MKTGSLFVSVDGPNGVGKSTLIQAIEQNLVRNGISVHVTKEVTNSSIGLFIRQFHREYRGKTLALLIAADRQRHIEQDVLPALRSNDIVICDRYIGSSLAFQGLDGVATAFIWKINEEFLSPHLSIFVRAQTNVIATRMAARATLDRFEESFREGAETRAFDEAAVFLQTKGCTVYRYDNSIESVTHGAVILSDEILHARDRLLHAAV